jgi:hypothetical protein
MGQGSHDGPRLLEPLVPSFPSHARTPVPAALHMR